MDIYILTRIQFDLTTMDRAKYEFFLYQFIQAFMSVLYIQPAL